MISVKFEGTGVVVLAVVRERHLVELATAALRAADSLRITSNSSAAMYIASCLLLDKRRKWSHW